MAHAFSTGQKFRFPEGQTVFTFISIRFENNEPIITFGNELDEECEAHGFYLSDLIHV